MESLFYFAINFGLILSLVLVFAGIWFLVRWLWKRDRSWKKGLIIFLSGVILLSIEAYIIITFSVLHTVSLVQSEMASMATAVEAFYVDNGKYPAHQVLPDGHPTFETILKSENDNMILTTPIDYISSLMWDWFLPDGNMNYLDKLYAYKSDPEGGWIMGSHGPDRDWDIDYHTVYDLSKGKNAFPGDTSFLVPWTYDATNGTWSSGDIWRVRQ
jgi:hypothetical protein